MSQLKIALCLPLFKKFKTKSKKRILQEQRSSLEEFDLYCFKDDEPNSLCADILRT